jgi:hypothetical protein
VVKAVAGFMAGPAELCEHGRRLSPSACEACTLESELFAPDMRRGARVSLPAQH